MGELARSALELSTAGGTRRTWYENWTRTAYYETLDRALTSTKRLQRLVEELLDVTRVEQGQMTLSRAEVDLGMLVSAAAEQVEIELAQAGASLSVASPRGARASPSR